MEKIKFVDLIKEYKKMKAFETAKSLKLSFIANRNCEYMMTELAPVVKCEERIINPSPVYNDYTEKRDAILKKYADKDDKGEVVLIAPNQPKISPDKTEILNSEVKKLDEEYKEVIEQRNKDLKDYTEILSQETECKIIKFSYELLPDDCNYSDYKFFIKETEEELEAIILNG